MTPYEELCKKVETINALIKEAEKFAYDNQLNFGQSRYSPGTFQAYNPTSKELDGKVADPFGDPYDEDNIFEGWISSSVCW